MCSTSASEGQLLRLFTTGTQGEALPRNHSLLRQRQGESVTGSLTLDRDGVDMIPVLLNLVSLEFQTNRVASLKLFIFTFVFTIIY